MNLDFSQLDLGSAGNPEGAVLGGHDKEFFMYKLGSYSTLIERGYLNRVLYVYKTPLSTPLPHGMSAEDVYAEVFAAAQVLAGGEARWG